MDALSRRSFLSSIGAAATGGLAGMSLSEAMAQPIEKLAENAPRRILGKTGWETPVIGFGLMLLRGEPQEMDRVMNTAFDAGINVYEAARTYGTIEDQVMRFIKQRPRDKMYISSKTHMRNKDGVLRAIDISLAHLKTDYIDQYMLHGLSSITEYNRIMADDGAIHGLMQAQKEGKIRFYGMTSHSIPGFMTALRNDTFHTYVVPYTACNREIERALNLAAKKNAGVLIMKPLGGNRGSVAFPDPKDPVQLQEGLTIEENLRYILSQPGVTVPIIGMRTVEDVKKNIAIAATFKPLTVSEKRDIIARADRIRNGVCGLCQGKPCDKACPNQVPVSFLMTGLNYINRFGWDNRFWGEKYAALDHDYLDCDDCGACEKVCPKKFEIRKDIKTTHEGINEQRVRHALRKFDTYYPSWTAFRKGELGEQEL